MSHVISILSNIWNWIQILFKDLIRIYHGLKSGKSQMGSQETVHSNLLPVASSANAQNSSQQSVCTKATENDTTPLHTYLSVNRYPSSVIQ